MKDKQTKKGERGKRMERNAWILLALSCVGDEDLSPVQLQKSLFLLKENKPFAVGKRFYDFIPYNYGPFSRDIYIDAEKLIEDGLIRFTRVLGRRWMSYSLTGGGKEYVKGFIDDVSKKDLRYLYEIVSWIRKLTFRQLISVIYSKYPKYKVNSVFSGE